MNFTKKQQIINIVLAILLVITTLNSAYFFMGILKLDMVRWLSFNACSLAIIAWLICFIIFQFTRKVAWLAVPLLPLYYYGSMGLFIMPWNEANMFAHITHIIITVNIAWLLYLMLKNRQFTALGWGLLMGMLVFVPVFAAIQSFTQAHMDEFIRVLQSM